VIDPLSIAATYFTIKYEDTLEEKVNIRKVKTLQSVIDILEPRFREREYSAYESGLGVLVRKQAGPRFAEPKKKNGHKICAVLEKETVNGLGMEDSYYYYVLYRDKTLTGWAHVLDMKKYFRQQGIYIPFSILKHMEENKVKHQSELILFLNEPDKPQPVLKSIKTADLFKFFTSHKMPLLISSFGEYQTAIPLSIMDDILL
jgi:hypothetical protein